LKEKISIKSNFFKTSSLLFKVLSIAGIIGLWVYAFFFAPSGNPDRIENQNWINNAEAICVQARNEMALLPSAKEANNPAERAAVIQKGTVILKKMQADLAELIVESDKDNFNTKSWLSDWNTYLSDRENHVRRLTELGDVEPLLTATKNGKSVVDRMNGFARVNDLESCLDPGDF
tara:strand:+ start:4553 stop:5080 length:528 start_codon:yes stop_codon:yes gene_type:complete